MLFPALSYAINLSIGLGISRLPFSISIHHYCVQESCHLMCEQWPLLKEAVFSQTQSNQTGDRIATFSMYGILTVSRAGLQSDRWGDLSAFAPLRQAFSVCIQEPLLYGLCRCQIYLFSFGN